MLDLLVKVLEWLVDEKLIGIPVAAFIGLGAIVVVVVVYALKRPLPTVRAERGAKVQQTSVRGVRTKGDVNVNPRQD